MEKHTFCYDAERKTWTESQFPAFGAEDRDSLPVVLVVDDWDKCNRERTLSTWCEEHHTFEPVGRYTEDGLVTAAGCKKTGLLARVWNVGKNSRGDDSEVDLRWQAEYHEEEKAVYLSHDTVKVGFDQKIDDATNASANVPFIREVTHFCRVLCPKLYTSADVPKMPTITTIPPAVASCTISLLQGAAESLHGFRPPVLLPPDTGREPLWRENNGAGWLRAFLLRPFDMNIGYFREFFKEDFFTLFPPKQRDNFPALCEALGMEPTDALRDAYRENPVYFVARVLLPKLGIRREDLLQKFRHIRCLFGEQLPHRYVDHLLHLLLPEQEKEWAALRFFCEWLGNNRSEEELAEKLLKMNEHWNGWGLRGMERFQRIFGHIPPRLLSMIEKDGMSAEVYDRLALLEHDIEVHQDPLAYGDRECARECRISGYNFRLISSIHAFQQIAAGSAFPRDVEYIPGRTSLYVIERNGLQLLAIFLDGDVLQWTRRLPDMKPPLVAKVESVLLCWRYRHGIGKKFPFSEGGDMKELGRELVVEPPDRNEAWDEMGAADLMEIPEDEIRRGYYLSLYRKMVEVPLLRSYLPRPDEDEREALTRKIPCCRRIFDAAWTGDPEAQYTLSLMYQNSGFFVNKSDLQAREWYKKACENGWREIMPDKEDVSLNGLSSPPEK